MKATSSANLSDSLSVYRRKELMKILMEVINELENTSYKLFNFHTLENILKSIFMYKTTISEER